MLDAPHVTMSRRESANAWDQKTEKTEKPDSRQISALHSFFAQTKLKLAITDVFLKASQNMFI